LKWSKAAQRNTTTPLKGALIMHQPHALRLSSWVRLVALSLLLGFGLMTGTMLASSKAHAATTLTVSDCSDDSQLDADISQANRDNAGDTINFSCSGDIPLFVTLYITGSMTLDGSGQHVTLDGQNQVQVLVVNSGGNLTLKNLTIAHGSSRNGGGINNIGGTVTISNSTFVNNSASNGGGGGIYNDGTVTISNSTFANNSASNGYGGGLWSDGTVTISNSTFANNSASNGEGGGIRGEGSVTISGSIVANNTGGNCNSGITDQGYNLSSDSSCGFTGTGSLQNTDPKLDPNGLQNNGGPTQTIALLSTSPAIDTIPLANCPSTDQRGNTRPDNGENACDMGAYEFSDPVDKDLGLTNMPSNITTNATSLQGAVVTYTPPTVVDEDNPLPPVNCSPASGSVFPIGTTNVTCTVSDSDDSNSPVSASFTVTVNDSDLGLTNMPSNITTNATSPQGAVVTYTPPTVVDEDNPLLPVNCSPASGSTFAIGTTTVTCTVSDSDDSNSPVSASFTVTVNDSDLGLTNMPSNITTNATSSQGAVVTYTLPTVVDEDNPLPPVNCSPASGSTFAIGTTNVTCTVSDSDDSNSPVSQSFSVTVQPVLSVSVNNVTATEGVFNGVVATGTAYGSSNPLSATISWGDGNSSTVSITPNPDGTYSVSGSHTYVEEGSYQLSVAVKDSGSLSTTGNGTATVSDAALTLTHFAAGSVSHLYASVAAAFTDADPNGQVADYTAKISWGDGHTTRVRVHKNSLGMGFEISGLLHLYAHPGIYIVTL
jgi:predicted outer membrane repeat protein